MAKVTLEEIKVVLLGVPNTDDRGIAGGIKEIKLDIKDINKRLKDLNDGQGIQNTAIAKNKTRIGALYWILGVLFSGGGITFVVLKLVGVA